MHTSLLIVPLAAAVAGVQAPPSPYAGQQTREIKALSADEIAGLEAGEGMGFAKPAELNGFPGPKHVLDLAEPLDLSAAQIAAVRQLFEQMREAAREAGRELIAAERALDDLFASGHVDEASLEAAVARAAGARGRVRLSHLQAHLGTRAVLSPAQLEGYTRLRGYAAGAHPGRAHHHP